MSFDELSDKIRYEGRTMTDEEWLECNEEYKQLSEEEQQRFIRTLSGRFFSQVVGTILYNRRKGV